MFCDPFFSKLLHLSSFHYDHWGSHSVSVRTMLCPMLQDSFWLTDFYPLALSVSPLRRWRTWVSISWILACSSLLNLKAFFYSCVTGYAKVLVNINIWKRNVSLKRKSSNWRPIKLYFERYFGYFSTILAFWLSTVCNDALNFFKKPSMTLRTKIRLDFGLATSYSFSSAACPPSA